MTGTYYRLHRADAPEFSPENAWSAPWGETFSADGDQYECRTCDATGEAYGEPCPDGCDEGWIDCQPGYSALDTAEDLLAYFGGHCPADDDDPVVIFEGQYAGQGLDGEPLAVPGATLRWTTIGELRAEVD